MAKNKTILTVYIVLIILIGFFGGRLLINKQLNNDFSKGVLAVNTDKNTYLVGETVKIQMTAVDAKGETNCKANLKLTINGSPTDKTIKSSSCGNATINNANYLYSFKPEKIGEYTIKLTDLDTKVTITNYFDVVNERNLDITRETPTSIDPTKDTRHPVKLIVTAKNDYAGEITDLIPEGLTVVWQGTAKVSENKISWRVDLKAGETKELIYEYTVPNIVPASYTFKEYGEWTVIAAKSIEEPVKIPDIINKFKNEKDN